MSFQIGEKVVYPNHGVGTIENISSRAFGTRFERFYLLRLNVNNMTVMVPCSHADGVGLRKVTKASEVAKIAKAKMTRITNSPKTSWPLLMVYKTVKQWRF